MLFRYSLAVLVGLAIGRGALKAEDTVPPELETLQPGVRLTVVAEHPDVATPTGIDVDAEGNVWVVSSHTHFRPEDYVGPEHDEVVVIAPEGERRVFYAATDATMDLELGADGWVYLAERDRILRVRDRDGDGVGDQEETLARLETEGDYPHNGLAGLAWHPSGDLLFSLGENYWKEWTLRSGDVALQGTGEGGVFRCGPDGQSLRRIAKGFWNPFGLCAREDGTMFVAENDPGARPPCRLLHLVEGGDYGYQRLYGSAPFHPFVAWNGQLRGTLPMVHSLGEAPCGIVPLGDGVLVSSWTDHRIDFYPLRPAGASFETERIVLAEGGSFFRPTCMVQASPTVFYFSDWVVGSYPIHGKGRVWKLEIDLDQATWLQRREPPPANEAAKLAEQLRRGTQPAAVARLLELAKGDDPFLARAALDALARQVETRSWDQVRSWPTTDRVSFLLAVRKADPRSQVWIERFWEDPAADVRFEVLRWVADEQWEAYLPAVEAMLAEAPENYRLFEATLAAWNTLQGNPRAGVSDPEMLMQRLRDEAAPLRTRAYALRLIDPHHPQLDDALIDDLLPEKDPVMRRELVRTLAGRGTTAAKARLAQIAEDGSWPVAVRGDALAGLASPSPQVTEVLVKLAEHPDRTLREESLRSLRFAELTDSHRERLAAVGEHFPDSADLVTAALQPQTLQEGRPEPAALQAWAKRLKDVAQPVDREAGRRIFYHASVGTCANCHRRQGRGNVVGPDLSAADALGGQQALLQALLQPSRDVAPQYFPRALVTEDGRTFVGILLRDGGGGKEFYRDNEGNERSFETSEIVLRRELDTSMMPDGLFQTMTDREIRDLLAFLQGGDT